jgi:hypothetical protein
MAQMSSAFTREMLRKSLVGKGVLLKDYSNATLMADAITNNGLLEVIAGRHDGKPIKFAAAFELVFGERLTLRKRA